MRISDWSSDVCSSDLTYHSIKNVLEAGTTPYANKNFKVFLQGSYSNDTNIYTESDVDIIIRLDACFQSDLIQLTEEEKAEYKSVFSDATYTHVEFKRRSEEHTSELQSLMRISYAVFCLHKNTSAT